MPVMEEMDLIVLELRLSVSFLHSEAHWALYEQAVLYDACTSSVSTQVSLPCSLNHIDIVVRRQSRR